MGTGDQKWLSRKSGLLLLISSRTLYNDGKFGLPRRHHNLNAYVQNYRAVKYVKQKLVKLRGKTDKFTVIV